MTACGTLGSNITKLGLGVDGDTSVMPAEIRHCVYDH